MFSPPSSGVWLADAVMAGAFCMNQSRNPDMFSADKLSLELTVTRSSPLGGAFSDCPSLVFLTESDEVTKTNRRPFSSASVIASISEIAFGASPWSGRLITEPFFRPSSARSSSKSASPLLLSQKRNRESASGTTPEALYTRSPFISSKGMGVIVWVFDCALSRCDGVGGAATPWRRPNAIVAAPTSISATAHNKMRRRSPGLRSVSDDSLDFIGDKLPGSANKGQKAYCLLPGRG